MEKAKKYIRAAPSKRRPFDVCKTKDGKNCRQWICYNESLDPKYFWTEDEAKEYAKHLRYIASLSYAFCMGKKNPARGSVAKV